MTVGRDKAKIDKTPSAVSNGKNAQLSAATTMQNKYRLRAASGRPTAKMHAANAHPHRTNAPPISANISPNVYSDHFTPSACLMIARHLRTIVGGTPAIGNICAFSSFPGQLWGVTVQRGVGHVESVDIFNQPG